MNLRPLFPSVPLLMCFAFPLSALGNPPQINYSLTERIRFGTETQAAKAFNEAPDLQARIDLLPTVASVYLRAHAYEKLVTMISEAPVPVAADAAWQRTFLLAVLGSSFGNADEAIRLLKQLPEVHLRDSAVLRFRIEHPALFGDKPDEPTPGLDSLGDTSPPLERVQNYLDTMQPDKALAIITARPDDFLDDLPAWHQLTAQFADQNLVVPLLPLVRDRARRRPDDWAMRLTLAQFQLLGGDLRGAEESLWQIYHWRADEPAPSPEERVAAMSSITPWKVRGPNANFPILRVETLQNARDLALISLAGIADERGEGPAFIHALEAEYHGDETGWITALMLLDSYGLVQRELRSYLIRSERSPAINKLAPQWLRESHLTREGSQLSKQEWGRLASMFSRLAPEGNTASFASDPPTPPGFTEVTQSTDPTVREQFLADLASDVTDERRMSFLFTALRSSAAHPDDEFFGRAAALLIARTAANVEDLIAGHALFAQRFWERPFGPRIGHGGAGLPSGPYGFQPGKPPGLMTNGQQVASAFFAQSATFPGSPLPALFPYSQQKPSAALMSALERLANEDASPWHCPAKMAQAYYLNFVPGQEDRALDLLRRVNAESPSYTGRFWLTALLAQRERYQEAADVFGTIPAIPGYFSTFLQNGRMLLQRAIKGEALFSHDQAASATRAAEIAASQARPADTADLRATLRRIVNAAENDAGSKQQALNIAAKFAAIYPVESFFAGREDVLKAFAKFGGLDEQIERMVTRAKAFPGSADAQLTLGRAWSLSERPEAPASALAAYRAAFRLAPDRVDIAEKMLETQCSKPERLDAICVVWGHRTMTDLSWVVEMQELGYGADALPRLARACGEGFSQAGRQSLAGQDNLRLNVEALRKAGQDDAAIDMLTLISRSPGRASGFNTEPEELLPSLLLEKGRMAETIPVVDRLLFSSDHLVGLDNESDEPLLRQVLPFVKMVRTPAAMASFEKHARQIMADHPGDTRAPLVLLTLLILDGAPALTDAVPACLKSLGFWQDEFLAEDLAALAQMAPASKPIALDLLEECRRWCAGKPSELTMIERYAAMALDIGDQARAEAMLKEAVTIFKTHKDPLALRAWSNSLSLLARAGMEPEAAELLSQAGPDKIDVKADPRPTAACVLDYMAACVRWGHPEMGRRAVPVFQRLLAEDAPAQPSTVTHRLNFSTQFLNQLVETFVSLDLADEAKKALDALHESSQPGSMASQVRQLTESAQTALSQAVGGAGSMPRMFVNRGGDGKEIDFWWDLATFGGGNEESSGFPRISTFGSDLKALSHRFEVQILAGETPDRLNRLATIPLAANRGS